MNPQHSPPSPVEACLCYSIPITMLYAAVRDWAWDQIKFSATLIK